MARRIVVWILGLTVLGLVSSLLFYTKEAGIDVDRDRHAAEPPASLTIRVVASSDGGISVDGRSIDPTALANEVARIIVGTEEAALPEPSFVIVVGEEIDNARIIMIMEALQQGGASRVSLDTTPNE